MYLKVVLGAENTIVPLHITGTWSLSWPGTPSPWGALSFLRFSGMQQLAREDEQH